jgi:hypothetical protein
VSGECARNVTLEDSSQYAHTRLASRKKPPHVTLAENTCETALCFRWDQKRHGVEGVCPNERRDLEGLTGVALRTWLSRAPGPGLVLR